MRLSSCSMAVWRRFAFLSSLALCVGLVLALPFRLTDGDSCVYAAMGHQIACGEAPTAAPTWAHHGRIEDFHESPPGAMVIDSLIERAGVSDRKAALVANVLWLFLLLAALSRLAGGGSGAGALAVGIFLLEYPVWKYLARASLDLPLAACVVTAVLAGRGRGRRSALLAGLCFGVGLLVRGVFALLIPVLLFLDAKVGVPRSLRRPLAATVLGLTLAVAFDSFHQQATGHPFWAAYFSQQVLPSIAGSAPHPNQEPRLPYYGSRLLLYALPWGLLYLGGFLRQVRRLRPEMLLTLVWMITVFLGAVLAKRQASRYLYAAWPGLALGCATVLTGPWLRLSPRWRERLSIAAFSLAPLLLLVSYFSAPRDGWWSSVDPLRARRALGFPAPPPVLYGPFSPEDDRGKQFLRHHLGLWAFRASEDGAPPGSWRVLRHGSEPPPTNAVLRTPLWDLVPVPVGPHPPFPPPAR